MKVIDKTPYLNQKGEIGLMERIKGTFSIGFDWYGVMKGQEDVIAALDKVLDSKYTLLRNPLLPGAQDVRLPIVLSGPTGVFLLNVINVRGMFRAKGEEWGTISNDRFKPLKPNLMMLTARYSQGLQKFLERQGVMNMLTVEPILLSANPGMHVDTVRPLVRVVMSDALERFAVSVSQARAVQSAEDAQLIIDRILTPKTVKKEAAAPAVPADQRQTPMYDPNDRFKEEQSSDGQPFAFSYGDEAPPEPAPVTPPPAAPVTPKPAPKPVKKKPPQTVNVSKKTLTIVVGVFVLLVLCLLILIGIGLYMNVR
jgi:hypothetical protein